MSKTKDIYSKLIGSGVLLTVAGMLVTVGMSKEKNDAHITNEYVHHDIEKLEETFVRKDVLGVTLEAMNKNLDKITKEMGIE